MAKKTKWLLITIVLVIAGTVYLGTMAVVCRRVKPDIRLHSDMMLVDAGIREELQRYYKKEGRYPDRLEILTDSILRGCYTGVVPEKPKELELLPRSEYSTDGQTYTLTWSVERRSETVFTYKRYGRHGAFVTLEMYIDGEISSRQIFGEDGDS
ncbi:MAG: hypothetical protein JSU70_05925 [Phycisphaerales bacterium]|nr:MAG: hypothetical protein JSU70_05925 [Phycisphaerales bacterium]